MVFLLFFLFAFSKQNKNTIFKIFKPGGEFIQKELRLLNIGILKRN